MPISHPLYIHCVCILVCACVCVVCVCVCARIYVFVYCCICVRARACIYKIHSIQQHTNKTKKNLWGETSHLARAPSVKRAKSG